MGFAYRIHPGQMATFERDGAVLLPQVVNSPWLERLHRAVDRALGKSESYFHRLRTWEDDPELEEFCRHSAVPGIVAQLLRTTKVNLFYDQVFVKEPATDSPTPWHNDQPYWPVRGWPVMTVWIALDAITPESGGLELIKGSHLWNRWFQPFIAAADGGVDRPYPEHNADYEPLPDFDAERDRHEILCWNMASGDAIAFHALTVHGARGNTRRDRRRRGYAVRYAGDGATYYEGPAVNRRLANPSLEHGDPLDSELFPVALLVDR